MFFCGGNFLSLHQLSIKLTPPVICRWYVNIYSSKCKKLTQLTTSSPIQNWFFKSSSRWSKSSCKQIQNWPNLFLSKTSQQLIAGRQLVRFPNPHYVVSWRIWLACSALLPLLQCTGNQWRSSCDAFLIHLHWHYLSWAKKSGKPSLTKKLIKGW